MGGADCICSDKTGTLTKNQMTVRQFTTTDGTFTVSGEGFKPKGKLTYEGLEVTDSKMEELQSDLSFRLSAACLSLCHNSQISKVDSQWQAIGDPTDSACAVLGWKINGDVRKFAQRHSRVHEFFFDTTRKRNRYSCTSWHPSWSHLGRKVEPDRSRTVSKSKLEGSGQSSLAGRFGLAVKVMESFANQPRLKSRRMAKSI